MRAEPDWMSESDLIARRQERQRHDDERDLCDLLRQHPYYAAMCCATAYTQDPSAVVGRASVQHAAAEFAASYGWPAVFRVLSQAIHEHDQLVDRR